MTSARQQEAPAPTDDDGDWPRPAQSWYAVGVPIARLADRRPRRTIIAVGVFFWSVMTVACGMAQNYWQLFLARVGVGVGEATLQPSAYSMLADYFPPQQLGRAIGTYASGLFLGGGLALIVGGAVIKALSGTESVVLPLFGEVRAWQVAFIVVGAPGVLLTLVLMATVAEPRRRGLGRAAGSPVELTHLLPFMRQNARTLCAIFGAFSLGGTAGTLFGGWYVDRLARRGHQDAAMRASILAFVLLVPLVVLPPLMPTAALGVTLLAPLMFVVGMQQGYSPVALQLIAPNEIRAQVVAVFFLVAQICALGFGPTAIALVTDYVFGRDEALRWSMAIVGGSCCVLALALLVWGLPAYLKSVQRAQLWLSRGAPRQPDSGAQR